MKKEPLPKAIEKQTILAITASMALVIALSWNEVIKSIVANINTALYLTGEGLLIKTIAALFTTLMAGIVIYYLQRK